MKTNIWIFLCVLFFCGCSDFLEESSQDEIRPATVDDMEQLLIGEVYMTDWDHEKFSEGYTRLLTDDIQCYGISDEQYRSQLEGGRYAFSWAREMFDERGGGIDEFLWAQPYERIKGCNVVIEYLDKVTGDNKKRENLRGEAYVMRGYYYFMLVNFFGMPYNYGDPAKNPGVPLKLDMGVRDEYLSRNSVAEVYASVEKDLLKGISLLEANPIERNFNRAGYCMGKAVLSRMYLYMEDWDNALKYADEIIQERPALRNLLQCDLHAFPVYDGVYQRTSPEEIIWARPTPGTNQTWSYRTPYGLSEELLDCMTKEFTTESLKVDSTYVYFVPDWPSFGGYWDYEYENKDQGDLRQLAFLKSSYIYENGVYTMFLDVIEKDGLEANRGIRTAEVYLNRAEAYIHKYMETGQDDFRRKALEDLNYLRRHRFTSPYVLVEESETYKHFDFMSADDLFEFYKEERRRELCEEGHHRWFDLRRYGMPRIEHIYFARPGETQRFVLEEKSSWYCLPIPEIIREANPKLEPNL